MGGRSPQLVAMVSVVALCCLVSGLVVGPAWGDPVPLQSLQLESPRPLTLVSNLSSRLGSHSSRLQDAARLSLPSLPALPSAQDLEAIKKVAQILVTLGQQVIPAIIGEPVPPRSCEPAAGGGGGDLETPNDPVNIDRQS